MQYALDKHNSNLLWRTIGGFDPNGNRLSSQWEQLTRAKKIANTAAGDLSAHILPPDGTPPLTFLAWKSRTNETVGWFCCFKTRCGDLGLQINTIAVFSNLSNFNSPYPRLFLSRKPFSIWVVQQLKQLKLVKISRRWVVSGEWRLKSQFWGALQEKGRIIKVRHLGILTKFWDSWRWEWACTGTRQWSKRTYSYFS